MLLCYKVKPILAYASISLSKHSTINISVGQFDAHKGHSWGISSSQRIRGTKVELEMDQNLLPVFIAALVLVQSVYGKPFQWKNQLEEKKIFDY